MLLIAHSLQTLPPPLPPSPCICRANGKQKSVASKCGMDLIIICMFVCIYTIASRCKRVLFQFPFILNRHTQFPRCHSPGTIERQHSEKKSLSANVKHTFQRGREGGRSICEVMNIGLIQLRFDILTVIIICFVIIEASLIIYSAYFRSADLSEAPVSAILSIRLFFLFFFLF